MSCVPTMILTRRLMAGSFLSVGGVTPPPPSIPHLGVSSGFTSVTVDPSATTAGSFTLYRTGGVATVSYSLVYKIVPASIDGFDATYFSDPAVLTGKTVTLAAGQSSVSVDIIFTAHAQPTRALSGSVQLSSPSAPAVIDTGADHFNFAVNASAPPVGTWDLGGDYTVNYARHLAAGSSASSSQPSSGVLRLLGGTQTADNANGEAVWSKDKLLGNWTIHCTLKRLDSNTLAGSVTENMIMLYLGMTGVSPQPTSLADWSSTTNAYTHDYRDECRGAAIVLARQTATDLTNTTPPNLRLFNASSTVGSVAGTSALPWTTGVAYGLTVSRSGDTISLSVTDGTTQWNNAFTSTDVTALADQGNFGLLVTPGRQIEVSNLTVANGTASTTTTPQQPWEDDQTQWAIIKPLASVPSGNKVTLTSAAQLGSLVAGKYYVLSSNIVASTTAVTINDVGTIDNPIVIIGDQTALANYRKLSLGMVTISNAAHVYFQNIDFATSQFSVEGNSHHISFERFIAYGRTGGGRNNTFLYYGGTGNTNDPVRYVRTRYFQYGKAGVTTTGAFARMHGANGFTNYKFPNHPKYMYIYFGRFTNLSDDGGGEQRVVGMWGDNERDNFRDTSLSIYNNLMDSCTAVKNITEIKTAGAYVVGNTYERGAGGYPSWYLNRHATNNYIGNLFVTRSGGPIVSGRGGFTIRDKNCKVLNNWAVTLPDGQQPTLNSPPGASADTITLFTGNLDTACYPADESDQPQGTEWVNSYATRVGGNNMAVNIGSDGQSGATPQLGAYGNIVAPTTSSRKDRNRAFTVVNDADYYGRGLFLQASNGSPVYSGPPAYGTSKNNHTTDFATPLVADGADFTLIPHRWLPSEVGPEGTAVPSSTTGGASTVSIGTDYTTNYVAHLGNGHGSVAQLNDGVELKGATDPTDLPSGVRMYNKTLPLSSPFKVRFKFTRKRRPTGTTSAGVFYEIGLVSAVGQPGGNPGGLSTSTGTEDDTVTGTVLLGWRFSFAQNSDAGGFDDQFRLSTYNANGSRTQLTPDDGVRTTIDLGLNTVATLLLEVSSGTGGVTAKLTWIEGNLSESYTSTSLATSGYLMLYSSSGADGVFSEVTKVA